MFSEWPVGYKFIIFIVFKHIMLAHHDFLCHAGNESTVGIFSDLQRKLAITGKGNMQMP